MFVVLGLLLASYVYGKKRPVTCYNENMNMNFKFFIEEKNSRIRAGGDLIENNTYYNYEKKNNYLVWYYRFTNQANGKKRINFNYYYYKEKMFLLNVYNDKTDLIEEDLVMVLKFKCR